MLEDWRTLAVSEILLKGMPFDAYLVYDSPLLCISFSMDIHGDEGDYVAVYTAFFDLNGNSIDD